MSKTTAPLLSFGASGQIAKTMVMSTWKGVSYARRYVIPSNPNTSQQQLTRNVFRYTSAFMKLAPAPLVEVWTAFAKGRPLTPINGFMSANIKALRAQADNDGLVFSNGAAAGIIAQGISAAAAGMVITATLTAPELPDGWTIVEGVAVATLEQDPEAYTDAASFGATDAATPFAPAITVPAAGTYVIGGWFKYNKGTVDSPIYAYGPSINTTAVVS